MKKPPEKPSQGSAPAAFTSADVVAMQAFARGEADSDQQKRAFDWITKNACALPVWAYQKDQRETDVALGRHFVGQQIVGILRVNISTLRNKENG